MPTGTLSASGKRLWEKIYQEAKANGDSEEIAAKKAWAGVKRAGWSKDDSGNWHKKADIQEFSLVIKKAPFDKVTGERRWIAEASDTDPDLYDDSMTLELFNSFLSRINSKEAPPEEFRSDFWSGGIPYLSVSHYPDLNGDASPGTITDVYIDGKFFKSKGTFNDTPLGIACWDAIRKDFELRRSGVNIESPVRVSIAFLDYKHRHKNTGTVYERSETDDICVECLKSLLSGKKPKREFLDGHLIHEAMTRVPVNQRTSMEVDKSMTTRKEDAASIIGEELAEELDEKAQLVGKSEALIIKADETVIEPVEVEEEIVEPVKDDLADLKAEIHNLAEVILAFTKKDEKKKEDDEDDEEGMSEEEKKKKATKKSDVEDAAEVPAVDYRQELLEAFSLTMQPVVERLDILISQNVATRSSSVSVPQRRSIDPASVPQGVDIVRPGQPVSIHDFVKRSVGL